MNILFLLVDQMRYDALGCNGAAVCKTPALDALAASGTAFDSAYTTCALCSPARASIVTGLYPHNHGQLANLDNFNGVFDKALTGLPTYFSELKQQGYQTGYVGKWHLDQEENRDFWKIDEWESTRKFYEELREQGLNYNMAKDEVQPLEWGENAPFCGPSALDADHHHDGWVAQKTMDMLDQFVAKQKPFVLCAGFFGPHFPYAVPKPYDTLYNPADVPKWNNFDETFENKPIVQQKELMRWNTAQLTWPDWQRVIATYWGYCTYIDSRIGMILDHLQKLGCQEETLIVFAADHGDMMGSHRLFNKGFNMYEEDNHIPMILRMPGAANSGKRCRAFVSLTDLKPTFTDIAGANSIQADGKSLLPLLNGTVPEEWRKEAFVEFNGYESTLLTSRMIRNQKWKYVYNPFAMDELYDMESDPGELRNLADMPAFTHVLRRMKNKMIEHLRATNDSIIECSSWQSNSYGLFVSDREL